MWKHDTSVPWPMAEGPSAAHLALSPYHTICVSEPASSLRATHACLSCIELAYYFACMMFVQMKRHFPEAEKIRRYNNET